MYLKGDNRSWGEKPKVLKKTTQGKVSGPVVPSPETLVEKLVEAGILEEKVPVTSHREAIPLLMRLLDEFRRGSDANNKKKQAFFIWAFREVLEKEITF